MATLEQLQALVGGASPEDTLRKASELLGANPVQLADVFGYDGGPSTLTSERVSSATDAYNANWYGLGEAASRAVGAPQGVTDWLSQQRKDNELQSQIAAQRAHSLGGVDDWRDVTGPTSFLNYAGGVGATSLPYLAEQAAWTLGDVATGGALVPAHVARGLSAVPRVLGGGGLRAGMSFAERRGALEAGHALGRIAANPLGYGDAVGDVLSNQRQALRDQGLDDSNVDLLSAAAGAVPYRLADVVNPVEQVAAGRLPRAIGLKPLDDLTGVTGGLVRMGATGLRTGVAEGTGETIQELANVGFGDMAVNPNASLTDPSAIKRYEDSFVGGGALGLLTGGLLGGRRRSQNYLPPGETLDDNRPADLLNPGAPRTETTSAPAPTSAPEEYGTMPPTGTVNDAMDDQLGPSDITDPTAASVTAPGAQTPVAPPPVRATADIADHTMRRYGGVEPVNTDNPDGPHTFGGEIYNDRELAYGALRAKAEADMQRVGEAASAAKAAPDVVHLAEGAYGAAFRVGEENKAASRKKYTPKAPDFASPFFQSLIAHVKTPQELLTNINARIAALRGKTKVADQEQRVLLQRMANVVQTPSHDNYMQGINNGLNGAPAPKPAERPETTEETTIKNTISTLQQFLNCMTGKPL